MTDDEFQHLIRRSSLGAPAARSMMERTSAADALFAQRLSALREIVEEQQPTARVLNAARELIDLLRQKHLPWRDEIPDDLLVYMVQNIAPMPGLRPVLAPTAGSRPGDAELLVSAARIALTKGLGPEEILAEAAEALALAQGVGRHLALHGPSELAEAASHLSRVAGPDSRPTGLGRAMRLSGLGDAGDALRGLSQLLGEVGILLVGVACETDSEDQYWACIELVDAADEAHDRVRAALRRLEPSRLANTGSDACGPTGPQR